VCVLVLGYDGLMGGMVISVCCFVVGPYSHALKARYPGSAQATPDCLTEHAEDEPHRLVGDPEREFPVLVAHRSVR
jgi:hypothetical protein